MFPEGTRSLKENLLPFKKGAFHLAIASQCPIQPVIVNSYRFLGNKTFNDGNLNIELFSRGGILSYFQFAGEIKITILPPIPTEGLTRENIADLIDKTYLIMSNYYVEVSNGDINPNNNIDKRKRN